MMKFIKTSCTELKQQFLWTGDKSNKINVILGNNCKFMLK